MFPGWIKLVYRIDITIGVIIAIIVWLPQKMLSVQLEKCHKVLLADFMYLCITIFFINHSAFKIRSQTFYLFSFDNFSSVRAVKQRMNLTVVNSSVNWVFRNSLPNLPNLAKVITPSTSNWAQNVLSMQLRYSKMN